MLSVIEGILHPRPFIFSIDSTYNRKTTNRTYKKTTKNVQTQNKNNKATKNLNITVVCSCWLRRELLCYSSVICGRVVVAFTRTHLYCFLLITDRIYSLCLQIRVILCKLIYQSPRHRIVNFH